MSDTTALLVAVLLLAGNAFFVGAEIALVSVRRAQVEPHAEAGSPRARTTLRAMSKVSLMMAGAQLGITVCSLGLGATAEPALAHLIEPLFESAGVPEALVHPVAFVIALTVVVFLHVVLGEMVPKNIAIAGPEQSARFLAPPHAAYVKLFTPLIASLNWVSNAMVRMMGIEPVDELNTALTVNEFHTLLKGAREEGVIEHKEHHLGPTGLFGVTSPKDIKITKGRTRFLVNL